MAINIIFIFITISGLQVLNKIIFVAGTFRMISPKVTNIDVKHIRYLFQLKHLFYEWFSRKYEQHIIKKLKRAFI